MIDATCQGRKNAERCTRCKTPKTSSETPPMLLSRKQTEYYKKEVFKAGLLTCLAIGVFPSLRTVTCRPIAFEETYSSGYCSGFTPDSQLSSRQSRLRQKQATKIAGFTELRKNYTAQPIHRAARTIPITTNAVTAWLMYLT